MFALWGTILPFSALGIYGTNIPSVKLYVVIMIGLLGYLIGAMLGHRIEFVIDKKNTNISVNSIKYEFNYTLLYILGIISMIYYIIQAAIVINLLRHGYTFFYIRYLYTSEEDTILHSSYVITQLKAFVAVPTTYLFIAIFPIEMFYGKRKKSFLIMAISLMVLFVLTSGGRSVILWMALYFIAIFMIYRKKNGQDNKKFRLKPVQKAMIIIGAVGLLAFMNYITQSRSNQEMDLFKHIFTYFVAPLPYTDHYLNVVDNSGMYGFGVSSFYGLFYPIFFVLRFIGIFKNGYPDFIMDINYMSFEMMEKSINIGSNFQMNAYVTVFYQPYLDGRFVGVFFILLIFGLLCGHYFCDAYYKDSTKALLIYMLLLQKIIFSFVRFYFTQTSQALCFLLAYFVIKEIKHKRHDKVKL